jgi:hypothetical protein
LSVFIEIGPEEEFVAMKLCNLFVVALFATAATAGVAEAQLTLVSNGDFSVIDGDSWNTAGSAGTSIIFETTGGAGGAGDGFGRIDNTAGAWGGVLVAEGGSGPANAGGPGIDLGDLGLVAGGTYDFQLDMIDLVGTGFAGSAGIKMENWSDTAIINDSTDQYFTITDSWETYTFTNWLVDASATRVKFVPLLVGTTNDVGFDNIGVVTAVPEPASVGLIALGMIGFIARRRRS